MNSNKYQLPRNVYRKLKQADREHTERFLISLYQKGFEAGINAAQHKLNIPFTAVELAKILLDELKNISVEQAETIINKLTEKYELKTNSEDVKECNQ